MAPTSRALVLVSLLAACPGTPNKGRTRETAMSLFLTPTAERDVLVAEHDSPHAALPHWYRVSLPTPSRLYATATDVENGHFDVELVRPDGSFVRLDGLSMPAGETTSGDVLIRVSGATPTYHLRMQATVMTAPADVPVDAGSAAAGTPCDYNKPDFTNPECCSRLCLRGPCVFEIVAGDDGPDGVYAWIGEGAKTRVVRGMHGTAEIRLRDGTQKVVTTSVLQVERERSKILVGADADPSKLVHGLVRVDMPMECAAATRPR